jgi:SNF2 family DNA or RNA helicase
MGVGKTPITIWAIEKAGYKLPLIVSPNTLRFEWARQIREWTGLESALSRDHAYGRRLSDIVKSITHNPEWKYRIVNYEILRLDDCEILQAVPWDVIVFDEIHKLRNPKTQLVKGVWNFLAKYKSAKIIGLSGSPIMNYPNDLFGPLATCFPNKFHRDNYSWREFVYEYTYSSQGRRGYYVYGSRNMDRLRNRLEGLTIRRTKEEVLPFLPDKYFQRVELEMKDDQRKVYQQVEKGLRVLLDSGETLWSPSVLSQLTRLRQVNLDPKILGITSSSSKTEYLFDLLESTNEKVVVFSCFERYIDLLNTIITGWGKKTAVVTGKIPPDARHKEVKRFQEEDDCRIFLGTIQAAGEGITLTASSTVVLADRWWNEPTNQQAIDRLHRIGQKNAVQVLLPICTNSIDAVVDDVLQRKWEASQSYYSESDVRQSVFSRLVAGS